MSDLIGKELGQYRIVEQIGQGGMATVYKAFQSSLDRYVAIKTLSSFHANQPNFSERFEREAKAIASLNHPNVLPVYDFGQEGDISFIVMRYIEGAKTLKEVMPASMEFTPIVNLIDQIAAALDYAHKQGIIHRDVKPSNVLMDGDWVLLSDFGLAKMTEGSVNLTGTGVGIGTPAYMSPEQSQGKLVDHRTDIYALGIILFEMLTGHIPYDAETPIGIIARRLSEPLPRPRSLNPNIPVAVESITVKALATNPDHRFAGAGALAAALKNNLGQIMSQTVADEQPTIASSTPYTSTRAPADKDDRQRDFLSGQSTEDNIAAGDAEETIEALKLKPDKETSAWQRRTPPISLPIVIGVGITTLIILAVIITNWGEDISAAIFGKSIAVVTPVAKHTASSKPPQNTPLPTQSSTRPPAPTATPLAFPVATDPETLILIATFHHNEGVVDAAVHNEIRRAIQDAIDELGRSDDIRVEVEPTRLIAEAQTEAEMLGNRYNAAIVIWGEDTGIRITVNYLNLRGPNSSAAAVSISETQRTQMADPPAYARFVTEDLPAQLAFLSLFTIGQSYYIDNDYQEAAATIEQALNALSPEAAPPQGASGAYFRLGWLYQGPMDNLEAAIAAYNQAIELNPNMSTYYFNRGLARANSGSTEQAIEDYTRAIELNSAYIAAFNNRGIVYAGSGDIEKAMQDFTTVTKLDPDYANAWNNLCWYGSLSGRVTRFIDACDKAIKFDPENGNFYDSRGLARALGEDFDGAIEDFTFYVEWTKEQGTYKQNGQKREEWIEQLKMGVNPFDEEMLEELLQ